jgi:hypothetical protein
MPGTLRPRSIRLIMKIIPNGRKFHAVTPLPRLGSQVRERLKQASVRSDADFDL